MPTPREQAHFRAIADGMDALNHEAAARDGLRSPEEKLLECFRLSELVSASAATLDRPDHVSLAWLWRQLTGRRASRG